VGLGITKYLGWEKYGCRAKCQVWVELLLQSFFPPIAGLQSGGCTERKRSLEVEDLKDILGLIGRLELFDKKKKALLVQFGLQYSNCLENEWHSDE
jgi:hypothetical protein